MPRPLKRYKNGTITQSWRDHFCYRIGLSAAQQLRLPRQKQVICVDINQHG